MGLCASSAGATSPRVFAKTPYHNRPPRVTGGGGGGGAGIRRATSFEKKATVVRLYEPATARRSSAAAGEMSAQELAVTLASRQRLLSCPDHLHHSEEEITALILKRLFALDDCAYAPSADPLLRNFESRGVDLDDFIGRIFHALSNIAFAERRSGNDTAVHSDMALRYFIAASIMIESLKRTRGLVLCPLNAQLLILTALMVASKMLDDCTPGVAFFGLVGGVSAKKLVELELTFCKLMDFKINVDKAEFTRVYEELLGSTRTFSEGALDLVGVARLTADDFAAI